MTENQSKEIQCFVEQGADFRLRPASHQRQWMDESPDKYAYRCLPLAIANSHSWEILCTSTFQAKWNGQNGIQDIEFATKNGKAPPLVTSHFGQGIITFHIPCLFKTPSGYDLWVMGPSNRFKPHIQALNAVVETDWSPYTFTMNWKMTTPGAVVTFEENDPIASIFPVQRGQIEQFTPTLKSPEDDPEFWGAFSAWRESRSNFNADLQKDGSDAQAQKWQKAYFAGPEEKLTPPHRTKLRLKGIE